MSRKVAFGGILSAAAFVMICLALYLPTGRAVFYTLSSMAIAIVLIEAGPKASLISYITTALLAVIFLGNLIGVIPFVFFFGHYGIVKHYLEKGKSIVVSLLYKLLVFNGSLLLIYSFYKGIMGFNPLEPIRSMGYGLPIAVLAAQLCFLVYDYVFSRMAFYYEDQIKLIKSRR